MRFIFVVALFVASSLGISSAKATVDVSIDLTHQRMNVTSSSGSYSWPISTARAGYVTPRGAFHPQAMYRMTYSPGNAAALYAMVKAEGAKIIIGGASPASRVAKASRGNDAEVAHAARGYGPKYARGKHGHGTKYARSTRGKTHDAVAEAPSRAQPAPQDMFGLVGGF